MNTSLNINSVCPSEVKQVKMSLMMNADAGPVGANGAFFGAGFSRETAAAAQAMEAHRRRRDGSMDQSEEDYFNTDDDDEEEEAVGPEVVMREEASRDPV